MDKLFRMEVERKRYIQKDGCWGNWMAQVVKHLTLDLEQVHDLRVIISSPASSPTQQGACLRFSFLRDEQDGRGVGNLNYVWSQEFS